MKVSLGTIEVNDDIRRAVRHRVGKTGLATRREVRDLYKSLADADLDCVVSDWQKDQDREAGKEPKWQPIT